MIVSKNTYYFVKLNNIHKQLKWNEMKKKTTQRAPEINDLCLLILNFLDKKLNTYACMYV